MFVSCSQAGTAAKAKNLFDLSKEYAGVSWRYDTHAALLRFLLAVAFEKTY